VNKWLRRLLLLFVIAAVAIGAAFYVLYLRRTPLPPAAPHALVAPAISSLPGLSACWLETGKTLSSFSIGSTAGSILVRHPAGDLLIDTGNSSYFDQEIRGYPFATWFKLRFLAGQLKPETPLSELLRRLKENPARIRWVILSHAHLDHSGGLMDLPHVQVLLSQEELQFAADPSVQAKGYVIASHAEKFPPLGKPSLRFDALPYETFDESADLYKDGSVVVVPLRGHTPGSVGIFVNLSPNHRLLYVGDAVDDERGFQERVGKSLVLRDSDNDEALANQIVARLSDLHEKLPELAIIPAHGRSAYKRFFPSGPLSCVSAQ
jgi:glyoxylase-like metal-dependent hydrolase (beta-lactamase superfamily II)